MSLSVLLFLFFTSPSKAQLPSPFRISFGGAGVASLEDDFSHLLNPANLAFHKRSKSAIGYITDQDSHLLSVVVTDLSTGIPLGINYERAWTSSFTENELDELHVSLGGTIFPFVAAGFTIHKTTLKESEKSIVWQGDLGMLLRITSQSGFGITFNSLLIHDEINEREINLGFYQKLFKTFNIYLDASHSKIEKWLTKGAIETQFKKFFSLRAAAALNVQTKAVLFSGGISFYGPKLRLDYGLQKEDLILQHAVIFKLLF